MATITAAETRDLPGGTYHHFWEAMGDDDTGSATSVPGASDRSIHVFGTFGSATVTVQGSCQIVTPTDWQTLHDVNGDVLTFTADGLQLIAENVFHIRVITVGGTGTDVDVQMLSRSTMR